MALTPVDYCAQLLRRHDPDRYLLSLFCDTKHLPGLWALYAFNHEIAKTREVVTETRLGLIRLQWWRDAISAIYEGHAVPEHQILSPLAEIIRARNLPRDLFDALVYAREFDLEDVLPADMNGLINYADYTTTPLLRLAAMISHQPDDAETLRKIGIVYALTGLLRAVPQHAQQGRCYLPQRLLSDAGISPYDLYDGTAKDRITPVTGRVRDIALGFYKDLKHPMALHADLAMLYLQRLKNNSPYTADFQSLLPFREMRLWWKHIKRNKLFL